MPFQEDIDRVTARLNTYRATLAIYLQQLATLGTAHAPPAIWHGIYECRQNIHQIKNTLRSWGASVEDFPDDALLVPPGEGFPHDTLCVSPHTAIITIKNCKVKRDRVRVRLFPKALQQVIEEAKQFGTYHELLFDYYSFDYFITNIGVSTINDFKSHIIISPEDVTYDTEEVLEFINGGQNPRNRDEPSMKICIYPQDNLRISSYELILFAHERLRDKNATMEWTIYLSDRPPSRGSIDLSLAFGSI